MNTPTFSLHSLELDARQRAMLAAMGVDQWWPQPMEPAAEPTAHAPAVRVPAATPDAGPTARAPGRTAPFSDATANALRAVQPHTELNKSKANYSTPESGESAFLSINPAPIAWSWDELTERIHSCQACGLCNGRQQAVPGMGNRQARWMIVGEAPGEQEDKQGLPFVGPAGQLLDAMLDAMGLTREADVYVANVIKCRPPRNRNPEPEEIGRCLPYLQRQIELVQPNMLLALGRFAAQALLEGVVPDVDKQPLGRLRGQVYTVNNRPLVVSYHPAYLLRNPVEKGKVWADLCLAMAHLGHNPLTATATHAHPAHPTEPPATDAQAHPTPAS